MKSHSAQTFLAIAVVASLAAFSPLVEAQRFGGFYYTTQKKLTLGNLERMCKLYGLDFAKYQQGVSKIAKVAINPAPACQSEQGVWNGECCKVSYTNPGQVAGKPRPGAKHKRPGRPSLRRPKLR